MNQSKRQSKVCHYGTTILLTHLDCIQAVLYLDLFQMVTLRKNMNHFEIYMHAQKQSNVLDLPSLTLIEVKILLCSA